MKDYFASIILAGVTGVTKDDACHNPRKNASFQSAHSVTPAAISKGDRGDILPKLSPPVTPRKIEGVTLNARKTADVIPVTPVTPQKDELCYFYHKRAGNMEYDREQSRAQAKAAALEETVQQWIYDNPPPGKDHRHCAHCGDRIGRYGYSAYGGVYLCDTGEATSCLQAYTESRRPEAMDALKHGDWAERIE